jgi:Methyltransferase domain
MAARRLAILQNLNVHFVCGDARFMPFKQNSFDAAYSYGVLQHFAESDAETALVGIHRVLKANGMSKIQMAHRGGLRATYHRMQPGYKATGSMRVRYWSLANLRRTFNEKIGPTTIHVEAFGGLGLLYDDRDLVSPKARVLIYLSEILKRIAGIFPPMQYLADSVFVVSRNAAP